MKVYLLAPATSVHTQKIAYSLKEEGTDVLVISFHKPVAKDINGCISHQSYQFLAPWDTHTLPHLVA